jgi:hypothetical protein
MLEGRQEMAVHVSASHGGSDVSNIATKLNTVERKTLSSMFHVSQLGISFGGPVPCFHASEDPR